MILPDTEPKRLAKWLRDLAVIVEHLDEEPEWRRETARQYILTQLDCVQASAERVLGTAPATTRKRRP